MRGFCRAFRVFYRPEAVNASVRPNSTPLSRRARGVGAGGRQHARGPASSAADDSHGQQAARRPRAGRRRRQGVGAHRRAALVRGTPHSDRCHHGHQHGRADRRRVRVGHDAGRDRAVDAHDRLGRDVRRRLAVQVQDVPPQAGQACVSVAARVRAEGRIPAARRPQSRTAGFAAARSDRAAVLGSEKLRRPSHAVPLRRDRPPQGRCVC